eukprot:TRINITY_DN77895_c0_g1_i1.p1 TRINITY_DN77895_c0_g1~~TRINITY_DN77895_c0_g1_i1.p1  ORF type:complete len:190 (-),score=26.02 TRINITY_DN77895_c0_g1_i1:180-749(-)
MVPQGVDDMAHLAEIVSASSSLEESEHYPKAKSKAAWNGASDPRKEREVPWPKQKARKVTFNLEQVEIQEYSVGSEEESLHPHRRPPGFRLSSKASEEESLHPPRRSPGFRLRAVDEKNNLVMSSPQPARDASQSDEDVPKKPHDFQPIVPNEGEKAQGRMSARLRAAMKEVRLRVSRTSQRVCPESAD